MSTSLFSLAIGVGTQNQQGQWLEIFYPQPLLNPPAELSTAIAGTPNTALIFRFSFTDSSRRGK